MLNKLTNWIKQLRLSHAERKRIKNQLKIERYEAEQERLNDQLREESLKQRYLNRMHTLRKPTYTKRMVAYILGIALIDIQVTYVLAIFDKATDAVVSLSTHMCTTILGVAFAYMIRAYFDSKAEYGNLTDEKLSELKMNLNDNIAKAINNAKLGPYAQVDQASPGANPNFTINIDDI